MAAQNRTFIAPEGGQSFQYLKKYPKPRNGYQETTLMNQVLDIAKEKRNKVIHIHGMPGSGKSQIIAAVCKIMADKGYIVWHVQCQQGINKLKDGWSMFVDQLYQEGIVNEADKAEIVNSMNIGVGQSIKKFIDKCNDIECPIILAVELEDADDEESRMTMADERALLRSFIDEIPSYIGDVLNVQLLVASRNQDILYLHDDVGSMDFYKTVEIKGFTKEESKKFLSTPEIECTDAKLLKLAEELAYSPLGLLMAKSYCQEFKVSYDQYYDSLGKDDLIISKEKELLLRHPDLGKDHRYEVIMKLLSPTKTDGEEKHLEFKVMKMVSFLNKNNIPSQVFESFFRIVKPMKTMDVKTSTTHLLRNLERYVGVNREETSTGASGIKSISLHGDILRVLNTSMAEDEKKEVLSDAVIALSSILDKDNRMMQETSFLYKIKNHIVQIAVHCSGHLRLRENDGNNRSMLMKDYEIMLGLSRIYELIGFAISLNPGSRQGNEEDTYYYNALECLWGIIIENGGSLLSRLWKKRSSDKTKRLERLLSYEEGKDPRTTAEEVFKQTNEMVKSNSKLREALLNDFRRNFPVKLRHLDDMKKMVGENSGIDWDLVTKELKEEGRISETHQDQLAQNGAIIGWDKLIKIYVVERMASILHSRGLQDKYKTDLLAPDSMFIKCQWWVSFGFHLCDVAKEKTGVKSAFHFLLRANNMLPRLTRNKRGENEEQFENRLRDVRETVVSLENENDDFYEHGIFKSICGTKWTRMNILKYLIKVNTKVHKRPAILENYPIAEADAEAEELYQLAKDNPKVYIAGSCLVHVAKYYAARNEHEKAIDTFELAFVNGIDAQAVSNSTKYAWALYNMQRAVSAAGRDFYNEQLRERIEKRLEQTERNNTPDDWKAKLNTIRIELPVLD